MLVSIDPDCTLFGWAKFGNLSQLTSTGVSHTPHLPEWGGVIDYVCEIPEDRPGTRYRKNDIIKLALAAGRIVGTRNCRFVKPSEWKGEIPKGVHHRRMRGVMSIEELQVLDHALKNTLKASHPEILDAVALGLTELGRL